MLIKKLKPRRCRRCKTQYQPKAEWQKYCGIKCRDAVSNKRRANLLREARKIVEEHERVA